MKTSRSFAPETGSIPAARRFVLDTAGNVDKYRHDAIAVMTSELVGQLSDTWGITPSPAGSGKTVWFQTALRTGAARTAR